MHLFVESIDRLAILAAECYLQRTSENESINHLKQMPIFGFNSDNYDLNLVKIFLHPFLVENESINHLKQMPIFGFKAGWNP